MRRLSHTCVAPLRARICARCLTRYLRTYTGVTRDGPGTRRGSNCVTFGVAFHTHTRFSPWPTRRPQRHTAARCRCWCATWRTAPGEQRGCAGRSGRPLGGRGVGGISRACARGKRRTHMSWRPPAAPRKSVAACTRTRAHAYPRAVLRCIAPRAASVGCVGRHTPVFALTERLCLAHPPPPSPPVQRPGPAQGV